MNDSLLMCRLEGFGDLLRDRQRLVDRHRAARDVLREILAAPVGPTATSVDERRLRRRRSKLLVPNSFPDERVFDHALLEHRPAALRGWSLRRCN
jgi:hypothetical protein